MSSLKSGGNIRLTPERGQQPKSPSLRLLALGLGIGLAFMFWQGGSIRKLPSFEVCQDVIAEQAKKELLSFTVQLNPGATTPRQNSVHFWVTGWKTPVRSVVYGGYCAVQDHYGKTTASIYDWQFAGDYAAWHDASSTK